jgi:hypothetical protein
MREGAMVTDVRAALRQNRLLEALVAVPLGGGLAWLLSCVWQLSVVPGQLTSRHPLWITSTLIAAFIGGYCGVYLVQNAKRLVALQRFPELWESAGLFAFGIVFSLLSKGTIPYWWYVYGIAVFLGVIGGLLIEGLEDPSIGTLILEALLFASFIGTYVVVVVVAIILNFWSQSYPRENAIILSIVCGIVLLFVTLIPSMWIRNALNEGRPLLESPVVRATSGRRAFLLGPAKSAKTTLLSSAYLLGIHGSGSDRTAPLDTVCDVSGPRAAKAAFIQGTNLLVTSPRDFPERTAGAAPSELAFTFISLQEPRWWQKPLKFLRVPLQTTQLECLDYRGELLFPGFEETPDTALAPDGQASLQRLFENLEAQRPVYVQHARNSQKLVLILDPSWHPSKKRAIDMLYVLFLEAVLRKRRPQQVLFLVTKYDLVEATLSQNPRVVTSNAIQRMVANEFPSLYQQTQMGPVTFHSVYWPTTTRGGKLVPADDFYPSNPELGFQGVLKWLQR